MPSDIAQAYYNKNSDFSIWTVSWFCKPFKPMKKINNCEFKTNVEKSRKANLNWTEMPCRLHLNSKKGVATKVCLSHGSCAVVAYAKVVTIPLELQKTIHSILFNLEWKSLVKWAEGRHLHDDVITWKRFPYYGYFFARKNCYTKTRGAGDLRHHDAHMTSLWWNSITQTKIGVITLRSRQNGRLLPEDILKLIFIDGNAFILIAIAVCFNGLNQQTAYISSSNGLAPKRREAII